MDISKLSQEQMAELLKREAAVQQINRDFYAVLKKWERADPLAVMASIASTAALFLLRMPEPDKSQLFLGLQLSIRDIAFGQETIFAGKPTLVPSAGNGKPS